MSNKRIEKKRAMREPEPTSPRTIRRQMVSVPCPSCAHPRLERRYLAAIGGISGSVICPSCSAETSYSEALARAMGDDAPPEAPAAAPLPPPERSTSLGVVLRDFFGFKRRWRFAA